MSENVDTVYEMLRKIRMDATAIQAKVTDALNALSDLNLPDDAGTTVCPHCHVKCRGPRTLAEHLYVSHKGPEPSHWAELDARTLEPVIYGFDEGEPDERVREMIPPSLRKGA